MTMTTEAVDAMWMGMIIIKASVLGEHVGAKTQISCVGVAAATTGSPHHVG